MRAPSSAGSRSANNDVAVDSIDVTADLALALRIAIGNPDGAHLRHVVILTHPMGQRHMFLLCLGHYQPWLADEQVWGGA